MGFGVFIPPVKSVRCQVQPPLPRVCGVRFGVWVVGCGVKGVGCRDEGLWLRVYEGL